MNKPNALTKPSKEIIKTQVVHQTDVNEAMLAQEPRHIIKHPIQTRREIRNPSFFVPMLRKMKLRSVISLRTDISPYEPSPIDDKVLKMLSGIMRDTKYLPALNINAYGSEHTTDNGLRVLSSRLYRVKSLSKLVLNFSGSDLITDDGLLFLSQSLRDLKSLRTLHLNFSDSDHITGDGLMSFITWFEELGTNVGSHTEFFKQ